MHKAPLTQTFAFIVSLVPLNMIWANDNAVSPEQRSTPAVQVTAAAVATTVAPDTLQGLPGRIEFTSVRHDFGTVTRGSRVTHSYEFVNAGKGVLHVRSIHATCGCVNTRVEPSVEFLPGQKGKITFEFDSTNFADSIVRTLTVDTDTPPPSTVTLTFTANIKQEIYAVPSLLTLGEIPRDTHKAYLFKLITLDRAASLSGELPPRADAGLLASGQNRKDSLSEIQRAEVLNIKAPLKAISLTTSNPFITAEFAGTKDDPKIKITIGPGQLPIGPLRERVTVWNNSRHLKELVIPVVAEITGHVKTSAKYIEFGVVESDKGVRRILSVYSDVKDFKIYGIEVELKRTEALKVAKPDEVVAFVTKQSDKGAVVHFDMKVPKGLDVSNGAVNASGVFVVKTNDPDYKEIRVPFFGVLRQEK